MLIKDQFGIVQNSPSDSPIPQTSFLTGNFFGQFLQQSNSSWIRIKRWLVVNTYLRETLSPLWLSLDLKEEGSHFAYMMGRTSWANRDFLLVNLPFIGIFQHKNLWPWSLWLCSTVPDCTAGLRKTFPDCNLEIINHWFIYFLSLLMSKMHTAESYQISRFDTEREKWIFFKAGLCKYRLLI